MRIQEPTTPGSLRPHLQLKRFLQFEDRRRVLRATGMQSNVLLKQHYPGYCPHELRCVSRGGKTVAHQHGSDQALQSDIHHQEHSRQRVLLIPCPSLRRSAYRCTARRNDCAQRAIAINIRFHQIVMAKLVARLGNLSQLAAAMLLQY